jgi:hypothetical protein
MFLAKNELHKLCVEFHSLSQRLDADRKFTVDVRQFGYQAYKLMLDIMTLDSQLLA